MSSEHTCDPKYLYVALNIASRLKTTLEKLVVAVNHLIKFDIESNTLSSCDAVGSQRCALKRTGTFASEGKIMCLFSVMMFHS